MDGFNPNRLIEPRAGQDFPLAYRDVGVQLSPPFTLSLPDHLDVTCPIVATCAASR